MSAIRVAAAPVGRGADAARPAARALAVAAILIAIMLARAGDTAAADIEAGRRKAVEVCAPCHGPDGNATIPGTPSLAGQPVYFTHWQLIKFKDGRRKNAPMAPVVEALTDADMADLSAYYQAQVPKRRPAIVDPALAAEGRRLADLHHCSSCHRPGLVGQQQAARLAGQDFDYLLRLLRGFRAKTASDLDGTMTTATQPLTDAEIVSLVHYLSSLGE